LFDTVFGAGFKVGFLFVVVGMALMYMPIINKVVGSTLDLMGFWEMFTKFPLWVQVVVTGFLLMGVAVVISAAQSLIADFINLLLGKDPGGI